MKTDHLQCLVQRPCNYKATVVGPAHACDCLAMQVTILFVQNQRRKSFLVGWGFKNFGFEPSGNKKEFAVGTKFDGSHSVSEVEVCHNNLLCHVDNQTEAVSIDRDKCVSVWGETQPGDV